MDNNKTTKENIIKFGECLDHFFPGYKFADSMKDNINTPEFDEQLNEFKQKYSSTQKYITLTTAACSIVDLLHDNIKKVNIKKKKVNKLEECNICMENKANLETSCHHTLCTPCCNKLKEHLQGEHVKCPFCRQQVNFFIILESGAI
jgi:hypothetical protein